MFSLSVFCFFACKSDSKNITPKEVNEELAKSKPTQDTVKMPEVSTINAQTFDILEGKLYWLSKKANSSDSYSAEIKVVGGSFLVDKNFIMNGKITLDATSLAGLGTEDAAEKQKTEAMLKSPSFFNTAKYPTMEFVIEGALPSSIPAFNTVLESKLKIKGTENLVNIPAKVTFSENICTFESVTFSLNYSDWNLVLPGAKPNTASKTANTKASDATPAGVSHTSDGTSIVMNFKAAARK
jgi:hypothetical protein